ncbi:glyoxalase I, and type I ring-cleaving dioxygenases, VOC family [Haloferula helveola]|uniref:Glyoxalase I, and type I ring-cleaving dioxygenases, VOC family n=1 Tax=Haloferula helveola TaxID=490095 RepID=A0ABN6H9M9_9BACT|nr:glyoxalase I, and type I ring-cleaving dioxygenases, VOC family [Haloferula helveola]
MRDPENVFHLAIPCADLDATQDFYVNKMGCELGRRYDDRVTLNFFGDQVVCHLDPDGIDKEPKMYPRHYGVTFRHAADYDALLDKTEKHGLPFFQEPFVRFGGKREEHRTFFLIDPSNNLLEFKHYNDPSMMY